MALSAFGVEDSRLSKSDRSRRHVGTGAAIVGAGAAGVKGEQAFAQHRQARKLAAAARETKEMHLPEVAGHLKRWSKEAHIHSAKSAAVAGLGAGLVGGGALLARKKRPS